MDERNVREVRKERDLVLARPSAASLEVVSKKDALNRLSPKGLIGAAWLLTCRNECHQSPNGYQQTLKLL